MGTYLYASSHVRILIRYICIPNVEFGLNDVIFLMFSHSSGQALRPDESDFKLLKILVDIPEPALAPGGGTKLRITILGSLLEKQTFLVLPPVVIT